MSNFSFLGRFVVFNWLHLYSVKIKAKKITCKIVVTFGNLFNYFSYGTDCEHGAHAITFRARLIKKLATCCAEYRRCESSRITSA